VKHWPILVIFCRFFTQQKYLDKLFQPINQSMKTFNILIFNNWLTDCNWVSSESGLQ